MRQASAARSYSSTNVAETSLTIDGVTTVIDTGLARIVRYDAERGIDRWELSRISRAAADQRAGRAGRTGPGRCIRLWSEREQRGLPDFEQPEIHRVDLCATVLALHAWGTAEPARFAWYDPPAPERLAAAERLLMMLGGLAGNASSHHPLGTGDARVAGPSPAGPIAGGREARRPRSRGARPSPPCFRNATSGLGTTERLPASTQLDNPRPSGLSDILDRLDMLAEAEASRFGPSLRSRGIDPGAARQVAFLRDDLFGRERHRRAKRATRASDPHDDEAVLKWLLLAYPDRVVKRRGAERTGVMVGGRGVRLGPESVVARRRVVSGTRCPRRPPRRACVEVQVRLASTVVLEWLEELFPTAMRRERLTRYDESRRRVMCANQLWYHDLLLREDLSAAVDPSEAGLVLAEALRPQAAELLRRDPQAALWLARLDFVRRALPELGWTEFDDEVLAEVLDSVCQGRTSLDEVERTDFVPFLQSRLAPGEIRELAESAPLTLIVPSGRQVRLTYEVGRPPILAVRLQELFGWTETPRLARGRVPVLLHLLGPEQSARPDHRRSEELLDDDLPPGEKRPPRPLPETCVAR